MLKQAGVRLDNRNIEQYFNQQAEHWDDHSHKDTQKMKEILDICDLHSGHKLLDVGCGTGVLFPYLLAYEPDYIVGVDISKAMAEKARSKFKDERLVVLNEDFYNLIPFGFDRVILFNAYPHFFDKPGLARKLFDVLNVGGRFIIAHDQGKDKINAVHIRINASKYSIPLLPASIEWSFFASLFTLDKRVDTGELYIVSGIKR